MNGTILKGPGILSPVARHGSTPGASPQRVTRGAPTNSSAASIAKSSDAADHPRLALEAIRTGMTLKQFRAAVQALDPVAAFKQQQLQSPLIRGALKLAAQRRP